LPGADKFGMVEPGHGAPATKHGEHHLDQGLLAEAVALGECVENLQAFGSELFHALQGTVLHRRRRWEGDCAMDDVKRADFAVAQTPIRSVLLREVTPCITAISSSWLLPLLVRRLSLFRSQ
jgi:hypothetical protein